MAEKKNNAAPADDKIKTTTVRIPTGKSKKTTASRTGECSNNAITSKSGGSHTSDVASKKSSSARTSTFMESAQSSGRKKTSETGGKSNVDTQKSSGAQNKNKSGKLPARNNLPNENEAAEKEGSGSRVYTEKQIRRQQFVPYFLILAAVLITISYIMVDKMAAFGVVIQTVFYGIFGFGALLMPVILIIFALNWQKYIKSDSAFLNMILAFITVSLVSACAQLIVLAVNKIPTGTWNVSITEYFTEGKNLSGGGVVGGMLGILFWNIFGSVGSFILIFAIIGILVMALFGVTPVTLVLLLRYKIKESKENKKNIAEQTSAAASREPDTRSYREKREAINRGRTPDNIPKAKDMPDDEFEESVVLVDPRTMQPLDDGISQGATETTAKKDDKRIKSKTSEKIPDKDDTMELYKPFVEVGTHGKKEVHEDVNEDDDADNHDKAASVKGYERPKIEIIRPVNNRISESPETVLNPDADNSVKEHDSIVFVRSPDEDDRAEYKNVFTNGLKTGEGQDPLPTAGNRKKRVPDNIDDIANESGDSYEELQNFFEDGRVKARNNYDRQTQASQIDLFDSAGNLPVSQKNNHQEGLFGNEIDPIDDENEQNSLLYDADEIEEDDVISDAVPIGKTTVKNNTLKVETSSILSGKEPFKLDKTTYENYKFPPLELLSRGSSDTQITEDEINQNIDKLMETLTSFKIRVSSITCSCGPTITRYEVKPELGIRVRSIANLVDDIALGLAKTGVRIEAPIPGKSAVGIEVPNDIAQTVYLRSLIETKTFTDMKSRISACLGADVSGRPIVFDIKKMPHLLIAGATGMGKSVCINSIIISLLYKARPDEVKLILIDPKKVEFSIYKDVTHLHVPIVSDPKKAAGTLATAVAEMERRFAVIEEVGVRDIAKYNEITANDPDMEYMPQIVIIIDELADLMMTAPDEVESSICRLAQKARAAGMHLIIGTQRPSVDVITGLIKANIPSRIAFTVASQVDSRTIIDIGGAEKLIGRGDMLFAPVGAAKPMRVQGAFVADDEVEKIVNYIIRANGKACYNQQFTEQLEREAEKCGMQKKGSSAQVGSTEDSDFSEDGDDPKFREAVKIAVQDQKISTSLLQRKLSIGYGRAAKIIDRMQEMKIVSPPDGNKPRKILISKEDYMRMYVDDDI